MLAERFFRMGIMFFITVWMARYLGTRQFGILNYVFSYTGLFTPFILLGLDSIVVKHLIANPKNYSKILGSAFFTQEAGALLAFIAIILSGYLIEDNPTVRFFFLIAGLGYFAMPLLLIEQWFQANVMAKFSSMARFIQLTCCSLLRLGGIISTTSLSFFIWILTIDHLIIGLGLIFFFQHTNKKVHDLKFEWALSRKMLIESYPLIFSALVIAIYMRIDQVMIGHMMNNESVGLYAAAVRVSQAWYFIPMVIVYSLFPALLNSKKESPLNYDNLLGHIYRIVFYISFIITILMYFFSETLIDILYGEAFQSSALIFRIHTWAFIFIALGTVLNRFVIAEGLQRYEIFYLFSAMVLNIILNTLLIPIYGIKGAAFSTVISQFFGTMIFPLFFCSELRKHIFFQLQALLFLK